MIVSQLVVSIQLALVQFVGLVYVLVAQDIPFAFFLAHRCVEQSGKDHGYFPLLVRIPTQQSAAVQPVNVAV